MIDKTPIPGLDLNSTEAKTQINNFWNYLDELAAKNPEEYKKFIQTQMKKGIEAYKKSPPETPSQNPTSDPNPQSKNSQKPNLINISNQNINPIQIFDVQPYLCLRFKPIKIIKEEEQYEIDVESNQIFIKDNQDPAQISEVTNIKIGQFDSDAFKSSVMQDRKVYLNILYSSEFYGPTDEIGNFLKGNELEDSKYWRYIPTEFRFVGHKPCTSGKQCDYYDVIVNKVIIDKGCNSNMKLKNDILGYICRKFFIFLNNKIILYNKSVKIVESRKYKSVKYIPDKFKSVLGMKHVAMKPQTEINEKKIDTNNIKDQGSNKENNNKKKNEIIIPTLAQKQKMEQEEENNNPDKIEKLNLTKEDANKQPVVIEEVGAVNKQIIPLKKSILNDHQMEVKFMFDEFEYLKGMKEIDLRISENGIVIYLDNPYYIVDKNYEPVEMKFAFKVDPDKCKAKYSKKEKVLTVTLERLFE